MSLHQKFATFVDLLKWRVAHQPDRKAYTFLLDGERETSSLTYSQLDARATRIATRLYNLQAKDERILILYPPGLEYVAAVFGCLYSRAVAVTAYPPNPRRSMPRIEAIVRDSSPRYVLTTSNIYDRLKERISSTPILSRLGWITTDTLADASADESALANVQQSARTLALLQYTSGSTGTPKGVMLTHANLMHNSASICECFGHTDSSRGVIWLPPYHDMGLIGGILQPLYGGFPVTLMSPFAFLKRPVRWLQAISSMRGTTSGGPNFAYDLCVKKVTPEERDGLDLSSWEVAFCGAEPIYADVLERFTQFFGPVGFRREALYPCYGLAETTLIVTGGVKNTGPVLRKRSAASLTRDETPLATDAATHQRVLVGCGRSLTGHKVMIVDPETHILNPPGEVGEIWIAGPSVAAGYWNAPEATEQYFRAHLATLGSEHFLRTGDLGFFDNEELFVTGRLKDLIIIGGRNHYPHDIEQTVERSLSSMQLTACVAFSVDVDEKEKLVVAVEPHRNTCVDQAGVNNAVKRAVWEYHEIPVYDVVLLKPMSIPRTSSGKIQRYACRSEYLSKVDGIL